ncbi:oligosaccharide flippase family protein, partial [Thiotrichales bacterium HSG1]|nr:oligosaccharide flippase family protein [Thiotrichales bacterium HSG1]
MTSNTAEKQGISLALLKRLAIRGSVWRIIGFGISQVMRFGGNIVLTRLLSPEAFGIIGTVTAVLIGLEMFSDVGLRPNIIQSQRGEEPAFIRTAWTIQIIRGIILTIAAIIFAWPLAVINNEPSLTTIVPVAGLTAIIAGFNSTWLLVYSRRMILGKLVILDLVSHSCSLITMMIWAWYYPSVWALVGGIFANRIVKVTASHTVLSGTTMKMQWEPQAAGELVRFGKWIFVSTALGFLIARLDIFVFGSIAGMGMLGIYLLAKNLSRLT